MGHLVFDGKQDVKTLTGVAGVILGTVVSGFFRAFSGSGPEAGLPPEVWFYPVGLLAGFSASAAHGAWERKILQTKEHVLNILRTRLTAGGKHITMISFEELERLDPKLKPYLVRAAIRRYSDELCHRTLAPDPPGGPRRPGVGLVP